MKHSRHSRLHLTGAGKLFKGVSGTVMGSPGGLFGVPVTVMGIPRQLLGVPETVQRLLQGEKGTPATMLRLRWGLLKVPGLVWGVERGWFRNAADKGWMEGWVVVCMHGGVWRVGCRGVTKGPG